LPQLIYLDATKFEIYEYFPNASRGYNQQWDLRLEEEYPYHVYAHTEDDARILKNVRKYIEKRGIDDVFYGKIDKSYSYCYNIEKANSWDQNWDRVTNHWWKFSFGSDVDLNMLVLQHQCLKSEMTDFHPEYEWHNETNTRKW